MLQKLLPAKWKITDQMELINLQLKNCHKPNNVIIFLQDMVMQKIGLPLLRHPKHS